MKRKLSVEVDNLSAYSNSADELRRVMDSVPDGAKFDLNLVEGDRPWESESYSITFTWEEEL